tara:strand:+ start:47499 stop:48518 length:1020 start_codon:yes stop_codon:yes gene_type:complete
MRLSEARLKEIIRQEVEYRLIGRVLDNLIAEELKKLGLNEDEWKKQKQVALRKKILQLLMAAGITGGTVAAIDSQIKADAAAFRTQHSQFYDAGTADREAKEMMGDYGGPHFAEQGEYFGNIDFEGNVADINSLPENSTAAFLASNRVAPSRYFITLPALLDKPIPKRGANTGQLAMDVLEHEFAAQEDKPRALMRLYKEYAGIGQVGMSTQDAAQVLINVNHGDIEVAVQPPEWTILFYFIVQEANKLPPEEQSEFINLITGTEDARYYASTQRGKKQALDHGWTQGHAYLENIGPEATPQQFREANPQDKPANLGKDMFDLAFEAAVAGESKPDVPS